jgi:RNA polymerase sigma factor (sigma-70 family)
MTTEATPASHQRAIGEVVAAARMGEDDAWREILQRYTGLVAHVARSYRLNAADTADVVQNTWARLFESISSLQQPERLGAWLATTTRREVLRVIRAGKRDVPMTGQEDFEPGLAAPEPDVALLRAEQRNELRAAMDDLPARHGALLRLLLADPPLSYQDISTLLDISIGSIGSTRARCISSLRRRTDLQEAAA